MYNTIQVHASILQVCSAAVSVELTSLSQRHSVSLGLYCHEVVYVMTLVLDSAEGYAACP